VIPRYEQRIKHRSPLLSYPVAAETCLFLEPLLSNGCLYLLYSWSLPNYGSASDNIVMVLNGTAHVSVQLIHVVQEKDWVTDFCEHGNEHSGNLRKVENFLKSWGVVNFSRMTDSAPSCLRRYILQNSETFLKLHSFYCSAVPRFPLPFREVEASINMSKVKSFILMKL
jgi:hypothetical protein